MSEFDNYHSFNSYLDIKGSVRTNCPGSNAEYQMSDKNNSSYIPAYQNKINELSRENNDLRNRNEKLYIKLYEYEEKIREYEKFLSGITMPKRDNYIIELINSGFIQLADLKKVIRIYEKKEDNTQLIRCNKYKK